MYFKLHYRGCLFVFFNPLLNPTSAGGQWNSPTKKASDWLQGIFHFGLWSGRLGVHCYLAQLNHSWTLVVLLGGSCDDQRLGNRTPRPNKVVDRRRAGPGGPFPITVHLMWGISKIVFRCGPCSLLVVVVNVSPLSPFPRSTTIECHRGTEVRIAGNVASSCSQSRPGFHQGPDIRGRCLLQKAL